MVKKIIFTMYRANMPISPTCVANYTVQKANIICKDISVLHWSRQQLGIVKTKQKRIIFTSDYGTGKSVLLKHKAVECLKEFIKLQKSAEGLKRLKIGNENESPPKEEVINENKPLETVIIFALFLQKYVFFHQLKNEFSNFGASIQFLGLAQTNDATTGKCRAF